MSRESRLTLACGIGIALTWASLPTAQPAQREPSRPTPTAESLLAAASAQAQAGQKNIFVNFGASWCGPCVELHEFMTAPSIAPVLANHFVVVTLTVWERGSRAALNNPGAEELMARWGNPGGVPFFLVLDASGTPVPGTARSGLGESGTVLVALLKDASPRMTVAEAGALAERFMAARMPMWGASVHRLVWTKGRAARPAISPDGRFGAFVELGDVVLRDLETGSERRLTDRGGVQGQLSFAPHSGSVIYAWKDGETGRVELRLARINTGTRPAPGPLFIADPDVVSIEPHDWSEDARWIAVSLGRRDARHFEVGLVDTDTGAFRLLETQPNQPDALFSPDAAYLALSRPDESGATDVWIQPVAGGPAIPVGPAPGWDDVVGWVRGRLLVGSGRGGRSALWAFPFRNGTVGTPEPVPAGLGTISPLTVTSTGSLFYTVRRSQPSETGLASFDTVTGAIQAMPQVLALDPDSLAFPAWSPGGESIAYLSDRRLSGGWRSLITHNLKTGTIRAFALPMPLNESVENLRWTPDGRAVAATASWFGGRSDGEERIYRIDAETGARTLLVTTTFGWGGSLRLWSPGNRIYFDRWVGADADILTIVEREVATSREREVFRQTDGSAGAAYRVALAPDARALYFLRPVAEGRTPPMDLVARDVASGAERTLVERRHLDRLHLSPDGRYIAMNQKNDPADTTSTLVVVEASGGALRELKPDGLGLLAWSADSRAIVGRSFDNGPRTYWWLPIDESPASQLPVFGEWLRFSFSPDGRRVVYVREGLTQEDRRELEVWRTDLRLPRLK